VTTGIPRLSGQTLVYQMAVTARGCSGTLSDAPGLSAACATAARAAGLRVVADAGHAFVPHGATVILVLAQSHLVVSTWPEHRLALVDLATCGPEDSAQALWETLRGVLRPLSFEVRASQVDITEGSRE
jgi:S-adenosylmethionine decarboxylase